MPDSTSITITELMEATEQWFLSHGYQKGTMGVYKATWNRFRAYSNTPIYSREIAAKFLLEVFGIDTNAIGQKPDERQRHARRCINALDEFLHNGMVCRRIMYPRSILKNDNYDLFFAEFLNYCSSQQYSRSWMDNTKAALNVFFVAILATNTADISSIDEGTIHCFAETMEKLDTICLNVRRERCRRVGVYLHWLYLHQYVNKDYSPFLPNFKPTPPKIPQVWEPDQIEKILAAIDTVNPVGKRNYAMILLMVRTGLRISDVIGLKFSNIDWKNNQISLSQKKTGFHLSLPLSKELGMAIITYLKEGRPPSASDYIFVGHNAPFDPLGEHNNLFPEIRRYMRRAGIELTNEKHAGVHTLRHSFATNMLKSGASVQDISQILGHSDLESTETYLRVDIEQLRKCALDLEVLL